jgi:hypothetical protein
MNCFRPVNVLGIMLIALITSCSGMDKNSSKGDTFVQDIIALDLELVGPEADKIWHGKINGDEVSFFRSKEDNKFKDVVVVTQDGLPYNYRSIEYCDSDGDSNLDIINIKMYHDGKGWNDIEITHKNSAVLNHATIKYKELLKDIRSRRLSQLDY